MSIKRIRDELVGVSKYFWAIEIAMIFCVVFLFINEVTISMEFSGPLWAYIKASTITTGTYKVPGATFFVPFLEGYQNNSPLLVLTAILILLIRVVNVPFLKKRKTIAYIVYGFNYLGELVLSIIVSIYPPVFLSDSAEKQGFAIIAIVWSVYCVVVLFSVILNVRQQNQGTAKESNK